MSEWCAGIKQRSKRRNKMEWKPVAKREEINYDGIGEIRDHTQRTSFYCNLEGDKIRIRLSNIYGETALILDEMTVGIRRVRSGRTEGIRQVKLNGNSRIRIEPGQTILSDEIRISVHTGNWIAVSAYIAEGGNPCGAAAFWSDRFICTEDTDGNQVFKEEFLSRPQKEYFHELYRKLEFDTPKVVFGVTGVDIYTEEDVRVIAAFGDSITHFGKWTDPFTGRMYARYPGKLSVINCGIAGNMLSRDHPCSELLPCGGKIFGKAGVSRFENSVFSACRADLVIILLGVNDILAPFSTPAKIEPADVKQMIMDYKQLIRNIHAHQSRTALGTICPFRTQENMQYDLPEIQRQQLNEWIRYESMADVVIPFDRAVQDDSGERLRKECDSGDGLHPSEAGGECMAETAFRRIVDYSF